MNFLTNINLNRNELQNAVIHNLTIHPTNKSLGQIYFNSAEKVFYGWDGTNWIDLGQVLTNDNIVNMLNASSLTINNSRLSTTANDAINLRHSHTNKAVLDGTQESFTTALKSKLDGIAAGAQTNQNAFSFVRGLASDGTTVRGQADADSATDTLTLKEGSNISISVDAATDTITIANTYSYTHPNHTGDVTSTGDGATVIGANKVTDAKFRQSAGLSVVGNAGGTTANVADITAGTDGHVLRRSGSTLGFGQIVTAGLADDAVTFAKMQKINTATILGRSTTGLGDVEGLTAAQVRTMLNVADGATKVVNSATNGNITINGVEAVVYTHPAGTNPHGTTKSDIGLGNVENKSSATIRGEITSFNVTSALGYYPIKNAGTIGEIGEGLESSRPAALGRGNLYLATDTGKIWKDVDVGRWKQMGGQDIPIASSTSLGTVKIGANLSITEDGVLSANDNPATFIRRQERFITTSNQTIFNLTKGQYNINDPSSIWWYLNGDRQDDNALTRLSSTSVRLPSGLSAGQEVLFEYFEIINIHPFPVHANEHLTGGIDAIPLATTSADGLFPATDKAKLNAATNVNTASTIVMRDASGNFNAGTITATLSGNASSASKWATARTITLTGDATSSAISVDGSANVSIATTLKNTGTAGTYTKVTTDAQGRVTSGTTLAVTDIPTLTLAKISDAGTAASKNTGTAAGNVPILGAGGKLDTAVLPAIAITETYVVNSQTAMLALVAETGDVAVRTDLNKSFILKGTNPTVLTDWQELLTPTDAVLSVNGKTGVVTVTASDVGLGNVTNESKATMFTNAALTGTPTAPTAAANTNTVQIATTAFVLGQAGTATPSAIGTAAVGTSLKFAREDHAHAKPTYTATEVGLGNVTNESKATMFTNAALTGTPTAPTAAASTNTTQIATTAFVKSQNYITSAEAPVQSVAGRSGAVVLTKNDVGLSNVDNVQQASKTEFNAHTGDTTVHITAAERTAWNAKSDKKTTLIGNGSATTFTFTHNLNTMDVVVTVRENATPYEVVYTDVQIVDNNNIKILFNVAPTSNQYKVVVIG